MLESLLSVGNLYWSGDSFRPAVGLNRTGVADDVLAALEGRFACASVRPEGGVALARDRLGLNKLFLAIHESGKVVVANYLVDLVSRGVPFESIYSAPSGHIVELDPLHNTVVARRYAKTGHHTRPPRAGLDTLARNIRRQFEIWFSRLAEQFSQRKICVCLSGGPDSGLIAALAKEYFRDSTMWRTRDPRRSRW